MILGLRVPAAESDAWLWAGRLLFVVAGTAVAWFLVLTMSGQAHAASPPVLPCVASTAPGSSHRPPADDDSADVPPAPVDCASRPLNSEQPTPASVAAVAGAGRPGMSGRPIAVDDLLPVPALDQQARRDAAAPPGTTAGTPAGAGNHGQAAVAAPVAAGNDPEPGGGGCAGTPGCAAGAAGGPPARAEVVTVPSAQAVPLSHTTADGADVPGTHAMRAESDVVPRPGVASASTAGWGQRSGSVPVSAAVRPSTGSASPGDAGFPPPPLPADPGPSAGASTTSASGSGGHDRFDALSALGGRQHRILPAASSGVPSGSDGNAIRSQARPEPRPD